MIHNIQRDLNYSSNLFDIIILLQMKCYDMILFLIFGLMFIKYISKGCSVGTKSPSTYMCWLAWSHASSFTTSKLPCVNGSALGPWELCSVLTMWRNRPAGPSRIGAKVTKAPPPADQRGAGADSTQLSVPDDILYTWSRYRYISLLSRRSLDGLGINKENEVQGHHSLPLDNTT